MNAVRSRAPSPLPRPLASLVVLALLSLAMTTGCPPAKGPDVTDGGTAKSCSDCASGFCRASDEACLECVSDEHCPSATPRCDPSANRCVTCLPGEGDNCPTGEYCTAAFSCAKGCKSGASCKSGICGATHDCSDCASDVECSAGNICGTGTCGAACSLANPCAGGKSCCGSRCVETQRDIAHCGACDNACGASQFCNGTSCREVAFNNVCANPKLTALLDGIAIDDSASDTIGTALSTTCSATLATQPQGAADNRVASPTTGYPFIGGGELLVVAGGPSVQLVTGYLDTGLISPLRFTVSGETRSLVKRDGTAVVSANVGTGAGDINQGHDFFAFQLVREPGNGTLTLMAYGFDGPGTRAAAYYFQSTFLPARASQTDSWYVFEWTDTDMNLVPGAADTFTLKASGK